MFSIDTEMLREPDNVRTILEHSDGDSIVKLEAALYLHILNVGAARHASPSLRQFMSHPTDWEQYQS